MLKLLNKSVLIHCPFKPHHFSTPPEFDTTIYIFFSFVVFVIKDFDACQNGIWLSSRWSQTIRQLFSIPQTMHLHLTDIFKSFMAKRWWIIHNSSIYRQIMTHIYTIDRNFTVNIHICLKWRPFGNMVSSWLIFSWAHVSIMYINVFVHYRILSVTLIHLLVIWKDQYKSLRCP